MHADQEIQVHTVHNIEKVEHHIKPAKEIGIMEYISSKTGEKNKQPVTAEKERYDNQIVGILMQMMLKVGYGPQKQQTKYHKRSLC